jgi:ABC-2 type transport system ATP-binding protein
MAAIADEVIVDVQNVGKQFDRTVAVQDVTFTVNRHEVFALLGPNGAGKTTLANLLIGNYIPDSGTITYYFDRQQVGFPEGRHVAYFPGDSTVYRTLPIGRLLFHTACKRGLREDMARQVTAHWLQRIGLIHRAETALSNLSRGNQQKVQFAEAILHRPRLVFFDEPFSGLDPVNQELFIQLIRELQRDGMTILLADHNMGLVERVANRLLLINRGQIVVNGTLDRLRTMAQAGMRIRFRLADPRTPVDLSVLARHPSVRQAERTASGEIRLLTKTGVVQVEVLNFVKTQFRISEILSEPASLHDIYVQLVSGDDEAEDEEEDEDSNDNLIAAYGRKAA